LQVALSPGAANMREIWRIDFDYCNNKLVAGGGSPVPFQNHAFSADTNLASISPIVLASTVPANHEGHDIALLEVDKYAPFAYMLFARETTGNLSLDNYLVQCPTPNLLPLANGYNTNHNFIEIATAIYYGSLFSAISNGYNGIAVSPTHVYTYDGVDLKKWNKTGTFNGGFNLPFNAPVLWGGLAVDICNNLYVGIGKDIRVYNSSLALINTISQPDSVYDIKLWPGGAKLYASGKGFVSEVTLPLVPSATISLSSTSSSCSGCTGTTSVSITACSVLSYTYSWMSGGQTTSTVTGLCPGTYTVNIFSNCNLIHTGTISVTGGGSLTLSPAQTNVLCNGGNTGSATITSSGGVAPYTYSWSPSGGSASTATGLSAGNYSVTITDGTGCLNMQVFTITQPPVITTTITATQTACGGNNGSASVIAAGGTGSYTYLWNPSTSSTSSSTGLSAGNYTVAIFDANNCTGTATVNVTSSGGPSVALANQTNVLCNGENTGAATVTAAGGSQPYTYNWSNGQTTSAAMTLNSGSYSVVVSDASGCSSVFSVIITQPSILTAAVSSTSSACAMNNGTAAIIPSGGNPSYSYLWSNGQTSSVASTLAGGTYSVMITDGNGCTLTTTVFVSQTGGPTAIAGTTATILQGSSTTLSASGAATYSWVPSAGLSCTTCPTPAASPSQTTEYCVHVYDASGCYDSACVTIFVITVVEPIDCSTTSMGDILLPNAFSPNGDSENDALKILCNAMECIETLTISIYNRWGEEVFKSDDRYFEWSGIYKGKPENSGVFAYMMKVKLVSGEEVTRNGNVSLIR
jgi:gliding motility-associated-like protein